MAIKRDHKGSRRWANQVYLRANQEDWAVNQDESVIQVNGRPNQEDGVVNQEREVNK